MLKLHGPQDPTKGRAQFLTAIVIIMNNRRGVDCRFLQVQLEIPNFLG